MTQDKPAREHRVLRPGGRAVMNIGERVPTGTPTQLRWGLMWLWADDHVQRMVEQAGFSGVTMSDAAAWGDDPLSRFFKRLMDLLGAEPRALRIVNATKE